MSGAMQQHRLAKVCYLGTSSGAPTRYRNVSSSVLQHATGDLWMFDAGEGTQQQFLRSPFKPSRINKIFVTHLHGDHIFGLPGFLCTLSVQKGTSGDAPEAMGETELPLSAVGGVEEGMDVVDIIGPFKLGHFLRTSLLHSGSYLGFKMRITELLPPGLDGEKLERYKEQSAHPCEVGPMFLRPEGERHTYHICGPGAPIENYFDVKAGVLDHGGRIDCFGYSITGPERPGKFNPERALELGVERKQFKTLQGGQPVVVASGATVQPSDVMARSRVGQRFVHLGDTCGSSNMLEIGQNADWLSHESTYGDDVGEETARERGHSTARMAGRFAAELGAKNLILTHFSPRITPTTDSEGEVGAPQMEQSTAYLAAEAQQEYQGSIICAHDFRMIELKEG